MLEAIRKALARTTAAPEMDDWAGFHVPHGAVEPPPRAVDTLDACWRPLADISQCGMFIQSPDDRLLYANRVLAQMLGCRPEEIIGRDWRDFVVQDDILPDVPGTRDNAIISLQVKDGPEVRHLALRRTRVRHQGASLLIGSVVDVTEQQRRETALREYARRLQLLSRQIIEVQESERSNLARELHDEIGQQLTLIRLSLEALRSGNDETVLDEALECVARLTGQVRDLSLDLRPSMLDDLGLVAALRWYLQRAARVAGIEARLEAEDAFPRLRASVETLFFRVAQEAITNVLRHSGATCVGLRLALSGDRVVMEVSDNGCGFDAAAAQSSALAGRSAGLLGMQERAALAGAALEIESAVGAGSRLELAIDVETAGIGSKTG